VLVYHVLAPEHGVAMIMLGDVATPVAILRSDSVPIDRYDFSRRHVDDSAHRGGTNGRPVASHLCHVLRAMK
jgi:hypothetical protein